MEEFFKWFHVEGYDLVARGERVGEVLGITREPPIGHAILVRLEDERGGRRIALPFEEVAEIDGDEEVVAVLVRPELLRTAPAYDPAREPPDEAYLARVREHIGR